MREHERASIARDLHDELGQGLTGLGLGLAWLSSQDRAGEGGVSEQLRRMRDEVGRLIESVRRLATRLRPAALDLGVAAAIEAQARELAAAARWELALDLDEALASLDSEREVVIFRIAQEALTNVARHAAARRVEVGLWAHKDTVYLEIRDDGRGIRGPGPDGDHLGVIGMRERALAWDARLDMLEGPGGGTIVRLEMPLAGDQDKER
jgi:signal transduction histidine kinase